MSFNIILQRNKSENNRIDKTIENISTVNGVLKADTSIIDPIIIINDDLSKYTTCNYMTIPSFNRSYFINDIISLKNNIFEVHGHVDVLSSFSSQIKANNCIYGKQESNYNLYLNDGSLKIYQNPRVQTKNFATGFTTQSYILTVAGSSSQAES